MRHLINSAQSVIISAVRRCLNAVQREKVTDKMDENRKIVESQLRVKGIPTMIYDGKRHTGLYKASD